MAIKNNKTCIICGQKYSYCPTCGVDSNKPSWYAIFDGENCHDIYEVCVDYRDGNIDKKVAKEKISKLDISGLKDFADATKIQINEIMDYKAEEPKKVEVETEKVEEPKKDFKKNDFKK